MATEALIAWIAVGLVAGVAASFILQSGGAVRYMIAGMLGALVAGWAVGILKIPVPLADFWIRQVLIALIGAVVVILAARTLS